MYSQNGRNTMNLAQALSSLSAQIKMRERYDNYIGGEWTPPADGRYFTNPSPISGQPLCEVARSTAADIDKALDAAHAAKAAWGQRPPSARTR
jgi:aldehyde dehydrogenase